MIAIHVFIIYVYLIVLLRFLGKKEYGQLTVFDLCLFLIISEILTMSLEKPLGESFDGFIATFVLVALDKIGSSITMKNKHIRDFLDGKPTYIIFKGKLIQENMNKCKLNIDDLCQYLRMQQVYSLSQVEYALLERNGELSIVLKKDSIVKHIEPVIVDGKIIHSVLKQLGYDENWLIKELKKYHCDDYSKVLYCMIEKEKLFLIYK